MSKLTIVCCIGNKKIFALRLGTSLKGHSKEEYDLITPPIKLTLAQAYNSIDVSGIRTKYIMFVHEDVCFWDENWIQKVQKYCNFIENLGVAGVAGIRVGGGFGNTVGYVDHWGSRGMPRKRGFGNSKWDGKIIPVQTLDAQMLVVPTEVFKKYKFNEEFPFHMMAEDYCLTLKYIHHLGVFVIPMRVWHNEGGFGRAKQHGNLKMWHQKLYDKWATRLEGIGLYVTSKAFGLKSRHGDYCPFCGGDVDTLETHIENSEYKFECRVCHRKWGKSVVRKPTKTLKRDEYHYGSQQNEAEI